MQIRDTEVRYGAVTRGLHWIIAALIAWQFLGVILEGALGDQNALASAVAGFHSSQGFVLFVLIVIRIVWSLMNRADRPDHGAGLLGRAARMGHFALYALMFIVPALALLRAYGSGRGLNAFGLVQILPATGERVSWMVTPASVLHGPLAWTLLVLIAGHIAMVVVHRLVLRDGVLTRMAG